MWIAGHIEHRYSERELRPRVILGPRPSQGLEQIDPARLRQRGHCGLAPREGARVAKDSCSQGFESWRVRPTGLGRGWRRCGGRVDGRGRGRENTARSERFIFGPEIGRDYPLNLSISLSGGKETNKDSHSNGEWSGTSPALNPSACGARGNVAYGIRHACANGCPRSSDRGLVP